MKVHLLGKTDGAVTKYLVQIHILLVFKLAKSLPAMSVAPNLVLLQVAVNNIPAAAGVIQTRAGTEYRHRL